MSYVAIPLPDRVRMQERKALKSSKRYLSYMRKRHSVREYSSEGIPDVLVQNAIKVASLAPSGANQQPWHFGVVKEQKLKLKIRAAAEEEEKKFYSGLAGEEWISALEPIGTHFLKPHLSEAPVLIVVFAQRYGLNSQGKKYKHYYVNESVGIAIGFLITALHHSGLVCLEHTPNPMKFLNKLCKRPSNEKPVMILPVGYPADDAVVPMAAKKKKPISDVLTIL